MPIERNQPYRFVFSSRKTDGSANSTTAPTLTISKDGTAAVAVTTAPTQISGSAMSWYVDLTATQMDAGAIVIEHGGNGLEAWGLTLCPEATYTAARGAKLDNADAAISTRSNHTASQAGSAAATAILATPAYKLAVDSQGRVTYGNRNVLTDPDESEGGSLANSIYLAASGARTNAATAITAANAAKTSADAATTAATAAKTSADAAARPGANMVVSGFAAGVTTPETASIASIKAKTDNLPAVPAAKSDADAATTAATAAKTSADAATSTANAAKTSADQAARPGAAMALTSAERSAIGVAVLDLPAAIDTKTVREALQIIAAAVAGKLSGAAGTTITIKGLDGTTTRITAQTDSDGNRTGVTY